MNYQEANEKLRGKYILVGHTKKLIVYKRIAIYFCKNGVVCVDNLENNEFLANKTFNTIEWRHWKLIEDETPSEPQPKENLISDLVTYICEFSKMKEIIKSCVKSAMEFEENKNKPSEIKHVMVDQKDGIRTTYVNGELESKKDREPIIKWSPSSDTIHFRPPKEIKGINNPQSETLETTEDIMHTRTIKIHSNQLEEILSNTVSIHDIECIEINSRGYIVSHTLKKGLSDAEFEKISVGADEACAPKTADKPQIEADILRRAKKICFKTGYVRRKNWSKGDFGIITSKANNLYFIESWDSEEWKMNVDCVDPKDLLKSWESVDPLRD